MNPAKLFLICFLFSLCGMQESLAQKKSSGKHKSKIQAAQSEIKPPEKKVAVSGTVTQTFPYCGGARPTKEVMDAISQSKPYSGKKFHVIKGETNTASHKIILSFTTDSAGNFSFQLPAGTYSILLDEQVAAPDSKKYTSQFVKMDEACFKDWWAKPYYLLEVPAATTNTNIKGLNFEFHHRCFLQNDIPCLQYDGPLPP
ncbi:MAG: prealbumin-like fold domain-containing protein [Bacteroidetes bacterium]|nr:prealbumin-like fold domain-containing protein [Bacteroidota bacterium]